MADPRLLISPKARGKERHTASDRVQAVIAGEMSLAEAFSITPEQRAELRRRAMSACERAEWPRAEALLSIIALVEGLDLWMMSLAGVVAAAQGRLDEARAAMASVAAVDGAPADRALIAAARAWIAEHPA